MRAYIHVVGPTDPTERLETFFSPLYDTDLRVDYVKYDGFTQLTCSLTNFTEEEVAKNVRGELQTTKSVCLALAELLPNATIVVKADRKELLEARAPYVPEEQAA